MDDRTQKIRELSKKIEHHMDEYIEEMEPLRMKLDKSRIEIQRFDYLKGLYDALEWTLEQLKSV